MGEQEYTFRHPGRVIARYASAEEYYKEVANHQSLLERIDALEAEKVAAWAVRVKPLKWRRGNGFLYSHAGPYRIYTDSPQIRLQFSIASEGWVKWCPTLESAKSDANADHIARVTAFLELLPTAPASP